nr:hypothetical protein I308_05464 [Cryptococcus tetragattii IND107]
MSAYLALAQMIPSDITDSQDHSSSHSVSS